MKKDSHWLAWIIAVFFVCAAGYSYVVVHHAEQQNAIKVARQKKIDTKIQKENKKMLATIKKKRRKHFEWNKSSIAMPYPDISQYKHYKTIDRVWIFVSMKKQRVYIYQGKRLLYVMYASMSKDYKKTKEVQKTPVGLFKVYKTRGNDYYDSVKGYGAKYWTPFTNGGGIRFESVALNQKGQPITKYLKNFGNAKKVTKKHNVKAYGSVRLSVPDAQWINQNIPAKTRVVITSLHDDTDPYRIFSIEGFKEVNK